MRIDIVTLFPAAVTPYLETSMCKRAQESRRVQFHVHDLRRWGLGKRRTVDDSPYGGGPGMVMRVEPFAKVLRALRATSSQQPATSPKRTRVLLTSAKGEPFTQRDAERYAKRYDRLVILCGHYEGVDERVAQHLANEEVSIGPFILTGGELPALVIADAVTRLVPGVLGNAESPNDESFALRRRGGLHVRPSPQKGSRSAGRTSIQPAPTLEHPHYTRPAIFHPDPKRPRIAWRVPRVLLGGDHAAITSWRAAHRRPPRPSTHH